MTVVLLRHAETYRASLPALVLGAPLGEACPLDFSGAAAVACEATGLAASLRFKPFRGGLVKGAVEALLGEGEWRQNTHSSVMSGLPACCPLHLF